MQLAGHSFRGAFECGGAFPGLDRLFVPAELFADIAEVLLDRRVRGGAGNFRGTLKRFERLVVTALLVEGPAETVQISGIVGLCGEGATNELFRVGQVFPRSAQR